MNDVFSKATGALALADGTVFYGHGFGLAGCDAGEACFNTAMTGYQEILTDPSYTRQIVVFTFPHIGNTGTNEQDNEITRDSEDRSIRKNSAVGMVIRCSPSEPSNWRSNSGLNRWARQNRLIGVHHVDTRYITSRIREHGVIGAAIVHSPDADIDTNSVVSKARNFGSLKGMELALDASASRIGHAGSQNPDAPHAIVVDLGCKAGILRALNERGARITIMPANSSASDIINQKPDGVVLSNGPGDPATTVADVGQMIRDLIAADLPMLAICLGHQLLALSLGGRTVKMDQGHHGANHPVQDIASGKVHITSMNHAFAVDPDCLPESVTQTQISLFDGSNCALTVDGKNIISVQYHPEAAPGPRDAMGLFDRFIGMMKRR